MNDQTFTVKCGTQPMFLYLPRELILFFVIRDIYEENVGNEPFTNYIVLIFCWPCISIYLS